jgi:4-diphosphocytidyl-2-C-methyl-D-erythritol kinase
MTRGITAAPPAKINLTLEVMGRRADGYHDLASVFATIDLRDRVRVASARRLDVRISPPLADAVGDDLASRAVRAMAAANGREPAAYVRVRKRIPIASGLGGGSSDAGAILRALKVLWRMDTIDMDAIAATVGSDVPFFARGAPFALVRGRGEHVEPLAAPRDELWIVLVLVAARVPTGVIFAAHRAGPSDGSRSAEVAEAFRRGTATPEFLRARLSNDLVETTERAVPALKLARACAAERGVELAMSGSGPSLFTVADDRRDALRRARILRRAGLRARPLAVGVTP